MQIFNHKLNQLLATTGSAVALGVATYFGSHQLPRFELDVVAVSLSIASGLMWIASARVSTGDVRLAKHLNFAAACLATASGVCLLP